MATAEKYDVALRTEVVKIEEMLLSGFTWKRRDCLADFSLRPSFSKALT